MSGNISNPRFPHYFRLYREKNIGTNSKPVRDRELIMEGICRYFLPTSLNKWTQLSGVSNANCAISFPREDAISSIDKCKTCIEKDIIEITDLTRTFTGIVAANWHISNLGANIFFNESKN